MRPAVTNRNDKEVRKALRWAKVIPSKEEKQRRAEERAQMLRKEHLMREIELGALNTKRYRTLWREMMMRIKMPQIAENIEIAWRNFDRALDIKDYRISFLMDELTEAEEQYQRNGRSHLENVDRILNKYEERMEQEERIYRKTLNKMLDQTDAEINNINHQQNEDEILLQSITRATQQQLEESLNNAKSITLSRVDAFVEDNKNIRRIYAAQLENQLQGSWKDLRQVLSDYQNKTKDRRRHYDAVKEKDEKDQQVISQQSSRTVNLFNEIRQFRDKITTYDTTAKKEISEIKMEHDVFQDTYWIVKNRFLSEQMKDKEQLKILTMEYNKIVKYLENLVTKGKQIFTLMQICRKYQTQDEKILPTINHTKFEDLLTPPSQRISTLANRDLFYQVTEDFRDLTTFWRRFGAVQIIIAELRLQRDRLKTEANHLRRCLNSYMTQKVKEIR